jgi:hypothetical protein
VDVDRHVPERLHRVGVDERPRVCLLDRRDDLGHRLDGPDLVVHGHYGNEDRRGPHRGRHLVRVHDTAARHADDGDLEAGALQRASGIEDGVVLEGGDYDVVAVASQLGSGPLDREVVGLGPSTCEDDLGRAGADGDRDPLARILDDRAGAAAGRVHRRRVAEILGHHGGHQVRHLGQDGRRRGVVQVVHGSQDT